MHIDVVQLHIAIALGIVAFAARAADRERRPRHSASPVPLNRVSPAGLHVPVQGSDEMQSATPRRSISTMWLMAPVIAAGRNAIALAAAQDRDQEWGRTRKSPAVEPQPQIASAGNRDSHT